MRTKAPIAFLLIGAVLVGCGVLPTPGETRRVIDTVSGGAKIPYPSPLPTAVPGGDVLMCGDVEVIAPSECPTPAP